MSTVTSKLIVTAISAVASCCCVCATAFAEPVPIAPLAPGQERFSTALSPEDAGAFAVQDYAQQFDVSEAEADRRLSLQTKTDDMESKLVERLGRAFGQLYFDNNDGRYVVALSPTGRDADARKTLDELGQPTAVITRIAVDHAQLLDEVKALSDGLREAARPGVVQIGLGERAANVTIAAGVSVEDRRRIDELVAGANIPVRVTESPSESLFSTLTISCSFPFCDTLVAGVHWENWVGGCTLAFYSGPIGTYYPRFLSAGHCSMSDQPPGSPPWNSCKPAGSPCPNAGFQQAFRYGANYGGTNSDSSALYFNGRGVVADFTRVVELAVQPTRDGDGDAYTGPRGDFVSRGRGHPHRMWPSQRNDLGRMVRTNHGLRRHVGRRYDFSE